MTTEQFQAIVEERQRRTVRVLGMKAGEYARGDRLSNFKRAAAALGCSPASACIGFWMKHVVSILDLVGDIEAGKPPAHEELWEEKIGDAINYLILLEAIVKEPSATAAPEACHP